MAVAQAVVRLAQGQKSVERRPHRDDELLASHLRATLIESTAQWQVIDKVATPPTIEKCGFRLSTLPDIPCPHDVYSNGLCIFHLLSLGEALPDHPHWKLDASIRSYGKDIRDAFYALLKEYESDASHAFVDFRGFRLPSIDLRDHPFTKEVRFTEARFYRDAVFNRASFGAPVDFAYAVFGGSTDFGFVTFKDSASFKFSRFGGETRFFNGVSEGPAEFSQSTAVGRLQFEGWHFEAKCSFHYLRLSKDGEVIFDLVNLEKASFLGTQLDSIEFRAVSWLQARNRQNMLADELPASLQEMESHLGTEDPLTDARIDYFYDQLAANYRQLVLNYERTRDFDVAEDFHVGEMRMRSVIAERRIRSAFPRRLWHLASPYRLYDLFSGYGASWRKACVWLFIWLLLVFPTIFMFFGFQQVDPVGGRPPRLIQYALRPDLHNTQQWLTDYCRAISFSLSTATFQRVRLYEPVGAWSYFFMIVASVIVTSQAALFLLALRRQFKR